MGKQIGRRTVGGRDAGRIVYGSRDRIGDIAVEHVSRYLPVIKITRDRFVRAQLQAAAQVERKALGVRVVRVGITLRGVSQCGERYVLIPVQKVVRVHQRKVNVRAVVLKSDFAKELPDAA